MGAYVHYSRIVEFTDKKWNPYMEQYALEELDDALVMDIIKDTKIERIQICNYFPEDKLCYLDKIFEHRKDITFRIYGFYDTHKCDISFLLKLPHVSRISMDYLREIEHIEVLKELHLTYLRFYVFDLKDYRILQELDSNLEELSIMYEARGKAVFDCKWLLHFTNLKNLYLGKVSKNIECIQECKNLDELTLRGIKVKSLEFLKNTNVSTLHIHWCSMSDLSTLCNNKNIRNLELWRIMKLEDVSFISTLENLETLKLMDLSNIVSLPELKNTRLKSISMDNIKNIKDIRSLVACKELEKVFIYGTKYIEVKDFLPLFEKENLKYITLRGVGNKKVMEQIAQWNKRYKKEELE